MLIGYKRGQGSVVLRVKILDSAATTGAGKTGLTYQSSGLIVATIADNESTAIAYTVTAGNVESISTLGTYAAPTSGKCRFKEVDSTNHKGIYEIQLADARYAASNAKSLLVSVSGATGAAETDVVIPLRDLDPYDSVRAGLTSLPNAAAAGANGLPTLDASTHLLAYSVNQGVNVTSWSGGSLPTILDAAGIRTAVGLAAANLDTQLGDIPTVSEFEARTLAAGSYLVSTTWTDNRATKLDHLTQDIPTPPTTAEILTAVETTTVLAKKADLPTDYQRDDLPVLLPTTPPEPYATSAGQTSILNAVNAITANTARSQPVAASWFVRPSTGPTAYEISLYIFDLQGNLEAPDAAPTVHARTAGGASRDDHLAATAMALVGTGHYKATYTVQSTDAAEAVYFDFSWAIAETSMADACVAQVQDAESVTTISAIKAKTDRLTFDGSDNVLSSPQTAATLTSGYDSAKTAASQASVTAMGSPMQAGTAVVLATSQPNYAPAKAGDKMDLINSPNATAITAIQSGLSTLTTVAVQAIVDGLESHGDAAWTTATSTAANNLPADYLSTTERDALLASAAGDWYTAPTIPTASQISNQVGADLTAAHGNGSWMTPTTTIASNLPTLYPATLDWSAHVTNKPTIPTAVAIADVTLGRGMANVEGDADACSLCGLVLAAVNRSNTTTTDSNLTIFTTVGEVFAEIPIQVDSRAVPIVGVGE